jgi:hypothetical protein
MADEVELTIPLKKVCFIIMRARAFDAKDVETDIDPGSDPSRTAILPCSRIVRMILRSRS